MSTEIVDQPKESVNPTENLEAWIDQYKTRDAEPAAPTGQSGEPASPAEPNVAQPQAATPAPEAPAAEPDWWDTGFADAKHGFLKGKKGEEVEKAFRHAETAKQQAERERNEAIQRAQLLEQQLRDREADAAVRRVTGAPQQPATPEVPRSFFEAPEEEARRVAAEVYAQQRAAEAETKRVEDSQAAGKTALQRVMSEYGIDEATANARLAGVVPHLAHHAAATGDNYVWTNVDNYLSVYSQLYGAATPAPAASAPAVPQPADPPGSTRAAAVSARRSEPSPLSREKEDAIRRVAESQGLDPERMIARQRARVGGSNA